jgi:hypothetical protein
MTERQRVSIHEASHAVCAHALGKTSYGCAIFAEGGGCAGSGTLEPAAVADYTPQALAPCYDKDSLVELANDAAITAAGAVGESLARFDPVAIPSHCDRMLLQAGFRAAFPGCDDYEAERAWGALAVARARHALFTAGRAVEAVSDALLEKGVLTAAQVAEFIEGAAK